MFITVTITHLEMTSPTELQGKPAPHPDVRVARVATPMPELNRFFYTAIGGHWHWWERLAWTYADWLKYLQQPTISTWVLSAHGIPVGYFELAEQPNDNVELVYFGLLPQFVGQGLGGWALTEAIQAAWGLGANRVWVHTCDLDHPSALANYQARGFRVFRIEAREEDIDPDPLGPWPNAHKAHLSANE